MMFRFHPQSSYATLSARSFPRALRVVCTLADLEGGRAGKQIEVAEALTCRRVRRAAEGHRLPSEPCLKAAWAYP